MLIIPEAALSHVMQAIVTSTHQAVTIEGKRYTCGTIDGRLLRSAALASIGIVVGVNSFFATIQSGVKRVQVPRDHLACDTPKDGQELRDTVVGLNAIIEKKNQKRASLSRKEDAEADRE